jgi:hypothetical protein
VRVASSGPAPAKCLSLQGAFRVDALFRRRRKGVWQRVALAMARETEIEHNLIDSAIVRARQHSAGASKIAARKPSDVLEVGWVPGCIWAVSVAGNPVRLIVTEGMVHNISCARKLVDHLRPRNGTP